jgi:hypothetical protein
MYFILEGCITLLKYLEAYEHFSWKHTKKGSDRGHYSLWTPSNVMTWTTGNFEYFVEQEKMNYLEQEYCKASKTKRDNFKMLD